VGKATGSYFARANRNWDIWCRWREGETQRAIAASYDISQTAVSQIIRRYQEKTPDEELAARRALALDDFAAIRKMAQEIVDAGAAPAYSNGRPILAEDGVTGIDDHSGRIAAAKLILDTANREARMLGLDAPQRVESTVSVRETDEAKALAADAAARLSGDET
jgi:hypothetical protein